MYRLDDIGKLDPRVGRSGLRVIMSNKVNNGNAERSLAGSRRDVVARIGERPSPSPIRALLGAIATGHEPVISSSADPEHLRRNCLVPLYRTLADKSDVWFEQRGIPWQGDVLTARLLYQSQADALHDLLARLPDNVPPLVLLKGMSVAQTFYPYAHCRPMRDMDVLIERPFLEPVETALRELGFVQRSTHDHAFYERMHHTMPFVHPDWGVWVEVHTDLFAPASPLSRLPVFRAESVFTSARPARFAGHPVRLLQPELQFLYLIGHWAEDFRDVGGVVGILDCLLLLQKHPDLNWAWVRTQLESPQLAEYVWLMMQLLEENGWWSFMPSFRAAVRQRIRPGYARMATVQRLMCEAYYIDGRLPGRVLTLNNLGTIWNTLRLDCAPWQRVLRLPVHLLFPPGRSDRYHPRFWLARLGRFLFSR